MKELEKVVKLIFIPCREEELKAEEWLLMNVSKKTLHVPAAGGEYRRLIQSGEYIPVKPYLVSNDQIKIGDYYIATNNKVEKSPIDVTYNTYCFKVIATPEQIHGCQIILFNNGVKENFDVRAMNLILRMNGGGCKIQAEYNGSITLNEDEILSEIKAGKLKPKLENGKVVITI